MNTAVTTAEAVAPKTSRQMRIPELDGLRGLAILMVVLFHYVEQQGQVASPSVSLIQRVVIMGWSGVDLFFVLSGFLIGSILLDARNSPVYFKTFYIRRFLRIIPIYYLWVVAYILLVLLTGAFLRTHSNSGMIAGLNIKVYGYFLFLQNIIMSPFGGIAGAWFGHLWSLAVEEQFYLCSPVVLKILSPRSLNAFLVSVIVGAPLLRILMIHVHVNSQLMTVLMPCRADSLAVGMLAALLWGRADFRSRWAANTKSVYTALVVLLIGMAALWKWSPQTETLGMETFGFTWMAFFYVTVLLVAISMPSSLVARWARTNWLGKLGRISYCIYIVHIVVNVICHAVLRHAPAATTDLRGVSVTVLAAIATCAIAWLSWTVFEGPLVRRGHNYKY